MTGLTGGELAGLFTGFRRAWRLERQPTYTVASEQPYVARFLAGEAKPSDHNADWHEQVREWAAVDQRISRVRVLSDPLTDYQRYQLAWTIPGNVAAGEDVRLLVAKDAIGLGLPDHDMWIIDDTTVVSLVFDESGVLVERELVERPDLDQVAAWREAAIERSRPWRDWMDGTVRA